MIIVVVLQAIALYVVMHVVFAAIWAILLPPIHFLLRFEWSRAAAIAGVLSLIVTPVVLYLPFETHTVKLDMPRPR